MKQIVLILIVMASGLHALASNRGQNAEPYSFKRWKEHQVVAARNQVVRLTNRMHLLKTGRYKLDQETLPLLEEQDEKLYRDLKILGDDKEAEKAEAEALLLKSVEGRMQMAIENLQIAKDLSVEDYFAVYLNGFSDDTDALKRLVDKLSKDEVLQLLQGLLSRSQFRY